MDLLKNLVRAIEKMIIVSLIIMMTSILILATIELGYHLFTTIYSHNLLIPMDSLLDLFGIFLLVLIGIELLDTIKVYLKESIVHVEVVVLVAIIALARKIVILDIDTIASEKLIGLGIVIIALSTSYFLIKKAGILVFELRKEECTKELPQDESAKK